MAIVTTNLEAWYDSTNPASNTGSGTTLYDLSGNGLNATINNPTRVSNYFEMSKGTTNKSIDLGSNLSSYMSGASCQFTIEMWMWVNSPAGSNLDRYSVYAANSLGLTGGFSIAGERPQAGGGSQTNIGMYFLSPYYQWNPGTLSNGSWIQYTFVNDGATRRIYQNGALTFSATLGSSSIAAGDVNFQFGGSIEGYYGWNGRFAIGRVYSKALTLAEIQQNYDTDYFTIINPPTVLYDFQNGSYSGTGNTIVDLISPPTNLTVGNGHWVTGSGPANYWDLQGDTNLYNLSPGGSFSSTTFTINCWWSPDFSTVDQYAAAWCLGIFGFGSSYWRAFCSTNNGNNNVVQGWDYGYANITSAATTDWQLFTLVSNGSNVYYYKDGVLIGSAVSSAAIIQSPYTIRLGSGSSNGNTPQEFSKGKLGYWSYFNTAFNSTQVLALYDSTKSYYDLDPVFNLDSTNAASNTGSGNTWYDLSPNNIDLTGTGTSRVTFNGNEVFDLGSGKYFTAANNLSSVIDWDSDWTIELWINYSGSQLGDFDAPWGTGHSYPTNTGVRIDSYHPSPQTRAYFGYGSGSYEITTYPATTITIPADSTTIHQFVVRKSGDTIQFLLDGVASYSLSGITNAVSLTSDPFFIGYGGYYNPLVGKVAVLRGYDYALSNTQVLDNYNTTDAILNPPPPAAAVHEYDAANPSSYPGSGSTLFDIGTATAIDLTINDATFNSTNDSFTLDGTLSSYIRSANSLPDFDIGANDFTIQYWFKYNAPTAQPPYNIFLLIGSRTNPGYSGFTNFTYSGEFNIGKVGVADYATGFSPVIGTWYQVTMTVNSSNLVTLYIDGVSVYSQTISFVTPANILAMGDNGIETDGVANASMGPLLIYDRVLTGTEITDYYDNTASRFATPYQGSVGGRQFGGRFAG